MFVMKMPSVKIPRDLTPVPAKMDTKETEKHASVRNQVTEISHPLPKEISFNYPAY